MMCKKILFISYSHFNGSLADAVQNERLIDALSSYYDIKVVARSSQNSENDTYLLRKSPNLRLIDILIYKIFPFLRPVFSLDVFIWSSLTFFRLRRILKSDTYILMVTYEPYALCFLTFYLRKWCSKTITFLYDPCVDNLFFSPSNLGRFIRKKTEAKIVKRTDALIINNKMFYNRLIEKYTSSTAKIHIVNFCSLNITSEHGINHQSNKIKLIFAGNLHGNRNLKDLLQVVSLLKQEIPNLKDIFRIDLYGSVRESDKHMILTYQSQDIIFFNGFLDKESLKEELMNADGFLLIESMHGINYSFPSKISDYLAYKKIIFAFSTKKSAVKDVLLQAGHVICDEHELEDMCLHIRRLIENRNYYFDRISNHFVQSFLPINVALRINGIINDL